MKVLSIMVSDSVKSWMKREWKRFFLSERHAANRNKDSKWLNDGQIQIYRHPFCTPKPNADLCMHLDLLLDK